LTEQEIKSKMAPNNNPQNLPYFIYRQTQFAPMRQLLPPGSRFVDIVISLAKAWKKHKEQQIDIQDAMIDVSNEFQPPIIDDQNQGWDDEDDPNND
jgi:hypothetical protein